jgi:transposase
LSLAKISSALKGPDQQRNIEIRATEIQAILRREHLTAPPAVAAAFGVTTTAAVHVIATLNAQIAELETVLAEHFETHPAADIYRSLPALGVVLGARVLGEVGDDPNRYRTAPPSVARTTPEPRH